MSADAPPAAAPAAGEKEDEAAGTENTAGYSTSVLSHIFRLLPAAEQAVTVSRLNKDCRQWCKPQADALRESRELSPFNPLQRISEPNAPPLWAVKEAWTTLDASQRSLAAARAAYSGDIDALDWMQETARFGLPQCGPSLCMAAAYGGRLDALQWLHAHGCPWDEGTCASAACNGHLEALQFLVARSCPWEHSACGHALAGGHIDLAEWIHSKWTMAEAGSVD